MSTRLHTIQARANALNTNRGIDETVYEDTGNVSLAKRWDRAGATVIDITAHVEDARIRASEEGIVSTEVQITDEPDILTTRTYKQAKTSAPPEEGDQLELIA